MELSCKHSQQTKYSQPSYDLKPQIYSGMVNLPPVNLEQRSARDLEHKSLSDFL